MPGADTAIKAAEANGYEAVILVILMLTMFAGFGFIGRWLLRSTEKRLEEASAREARLAARISTLEGFVESTLVKLIQDTTGLMQRNIETISALTAALSGRLCLLDVAKQDEIVAKLAGRVAHELHPKS